MNISSDFLYFIVRVDSTNTVTEYWCHVMCVCRWNVV